MPNPFSGMNPYLEQPEYWSDFHNQLVTALARVLIPQLLPKYRVVTDKWVYKIADSTSIAIGRPDVSVQQNRANVPSVQSTATASPALTQPVKVIVPLFQEVQQAYIEVKDAATQAVITAIEVLSPANKKGDGRRKYEAKRQQILGSSTHLIEIDLLRDGDPLPVEPVPIEPVPIEQRLTEQGFPEQGFPEQPERTDSQSHYRILISRSDTRPIADLYPFNLGDRIPAFPLPLRLEDAEPIVDLQQIVNDLYEQLGYDYFVDYNSPPPSPWSLSEVTQKSL